MKISLFKKVFVLALFAAAGAPLLAQSWQFVGTRAMGMGGAGVADTSGTDAQYWNPAGLAQDEGVRDNGFTINAGVSLETTKDVLNGVSGLVDKTNQYKQLADDISGDNAPSAQDISAIFSGMSDIAKLTGSDAGAIINADAGVGFKIKNFAVTARALGNGAILPVVDLKNIGLSDGVDGLQLGATSTPVNADNQASAQKLANSIDSNGVFSGLNNLLGGSYANSTQLANAIINGAVNAGSSAQDITSAVQTAADNMADAKEIISNIATGSYDDNTTHAMADAATFGEVSLGYGMEVIKGLKVGGNVKVISGYTAQSGVMIMTDDQDISNILDKAYDNKKNTTNLGVDLGAMLNLSRLLGTNIIFNPRFGITAKNINGPKFERPDVPVGIDPAIAASWNKEDYQLKPQVRVGAAVNPLKFITLAADLDITENSTLINDFNSRQLAVGAELKVINGKNFALPLRVGINKNLANSNSAMFYTAGIGFDMLRMRIELAGAISSESADVDGHTVPSSAAAALTWALVF